MFLSEACHVSPGWVGWLWDHLKLHASERDMCTQVSVSQDYIGGLQLTPDGGMVVVAAADGVASLLEMRKAGARLSHAACGAPLRCIDTDGSLALLGTETGQVSCSPLISYLGASRDALPVEMSCGPFLSCIGPNALLRKTVT